MSRKGNSSNRWLERQRRDKYVQAARDAGYRSRAAYKLIELDERFGLLKPGSVVLDLGAAPGGWAQVAAHKVGERGHVVAVDRLPIDPLAGVLLLERELGDEASFEAVRVALGGRPPDLVMCDLAPNMSGIKVADQLRGIGLVEFAVDAALELLGPGGNFVSKVFDGPGLDEVRRTLRGRFRQLKDVKPQASRAASSEHYVVALGLKPDKA